MDGAPGAEEVSWRVGGGEGGGGVRRGGEGGGGVRREAGRAGGKGKGPFPWKCGEGVGVVGGEVGGDLEEGADDEISDLLGRDGGGRGGGGDGDGRASAGRMEGEGGGGEEESDQSDDGTYPHGAGVDLLWREVELR